MILPIPLTDWQPVRTGWRTGRAAPEGASWRGIMVGACARIRVRRRRTRPPRSERSWCAWGRGPSAESIERRECRKHRAARVLSAEEHQARRNVVGWSLSSAERVGRAEARRLRLGGPPARGRPGGGWPAVRRAGAPGANARALPGRGRWDALACASGRGGRPPPWPPRPGAGAGLSRPGLRRSPRPTWRNRARAPRAACPRSGRRCRDCP